ncbi:MAG TPA: hypothetical protein VK979_05360 [Guyparkeria sp.]|nr:hypothetical protein [Guyparkeria sp.]
MTESMFINHEAAVMHSAAVALTAAAGRIPVGGIERVLTDASYRAEMITNIDPALVDASAQAAVRYWTEEYPQMSELVRSAITATTLSGEAA